MERNLEILLQREKKEVLNYVSDNVREILDAMEKIVKFCTDINEGKNSAYEKPKKIVTLKDERKFPTSIFDPPNSFPRNSSINLDSD